MKSFGKKDWKKATSEKSILNNYFSQKSIEKQFTLGKCSKLQFGKENWKDNKSVLANNEVFDYDRNDLERH